MAKRGVYNKVACKSGHLYTDKNTGHFKNGQRYCKACVSKRVLDHLRRKKDAE